MIENTAQHNTEITNFNISDTNNNTRQRLSEIRIRGTVSARLVHASTNRPITVGCLQHLPIRFSRQLSGLVGR